MPTMKSFSPSPTSFVLVALTALAGASCSSSAAAPPSAYIQSTLGQNTTPGFTATCSAAPADTPYVNVGTSGTPVPTGNVNGQNVTVTCQVQAATASTYNVTVDVEDGANGAIQFSGTVASSTTTPASGILASFSTTNGGSFVSKVCTIALSTEFMPAITAGRIAGTLTCPTLMDDSQGMNDTCLGMATFIVENCEE
jgi:hypothetical protein